MDEPTLEISLELLYHYRCLKCAKWWSVADIEPVAGKDVFCPHCGTKHVTPDKVLLGEDFKKEKVKSPKEDVTIGVTCWEDSKEKKVRDWKRSIMRVLENDPVDLAGKQVVAYSDIFIPRSIQGIRLADIIIPAGEKGEVQHFVPAKTGNNQSTQDCLVVLWEKQGQTWVSKHQFDSLELIL